MSAAPLPSRTAPPTALDALVGDGRRFLASTFGRAPLHLPGSSQRASVAPLSLDDIDHLLTDGGLRAPAFRLVRDGVTLPRTQVTRSARIGSRPVHDLVDTAAVHAAIADGATLVLQGLHRSWAPVAELCRGLETELTHPVQANAYLTPPVAQGLQVHTDPHDVFVVQVEGTKRWVVHPSGADAAWDLTLRPGEVLYLPSGTPHAAQTQQQPSLHLTIGVRTVRWRTLMETALAQVLDDRPDLDASLPGGWATHPDDLRGPLRDVLDEIADAVRAQPVEAALTSQQRTFWEGRRPDRRGGLHDALVTAHLDDTTPLWVRPHLYARLADDDDRAVLHLSDRQLRFPRWLRPVVEDILQRDQVCARDLAAHLDAPGRLVLCRRLLRDGVLTTTGPERRRP